MRPRRPLGALLTLVLALALLAPAATAAEPAVQAEDPASDTLETLPDYHHGKPLPLREGRAETSEQPGFRALQTEPESETRQWLALDDYEGIIYLKEYTLRGVGEHIEVWIASDSDEISEGINFQDGDCRNGERTTITDEQVAYLIEEFDGNIYPKESEAFSVAPERSGENAILPGLVGLPDDYYAGEGDHTVVLVDNVRDDNFYDDNNSQGLPYIAGFFYSVFNEYHDRNIMTIDAFDWLHRTTANPPNEPSEDLCENAPARPFLYEGVFAHEYQHLLHSYTDADETTWLNEALSDWAQTLTGYVDPSLPITDQGFDSHIQCFLGWLGVKTDANPIPRPQSGPENSLTLWGDQGAAEILCDYGAVYSMAEFLHGRYGTPFLSALHNDEANGLDSLEQQLTAAGDDRSALDVVHEWAAMMAVDSALDRNGGRLLHWEDEDRRPVRDAGDYRTPTLDAAIRWETEEAYSTPGAPPNGSDYVRLRDAPGRWLSARQLRSLSFDGAETLPPLPVEWTVDENPPEHEGDPALYSGSGPNFDRAIARAVSVPASDPTLTFETRYEIETGWDFGFVQVSTDGGATWTSLGNDDTTTETDPGAIAPVQQNVPGFTGSSDGWITTSFDLSDYAGQDVLLAFRYVTDPAVDEPGWWVDDVTVGGDLISDGSSLEGWQSFTQIRPVPVAGFAVQLVALGGARGRAPVVLAELPLDEQFNVELSASDLRRRLLGLPHDTVAVIVTSDDPAESVSQYAPYTLTVNGVVQPGGS